MAKYIITNQEKIQIAIWFDGASGLVEVGGGEADLREIGNIVTDYFDHPFSKERPTKNNKIRISVSLTSAEFVKGINKIGRECFFDVKKVQSIKYIM